MSGGGIRDRKAIADEDFTAEDRGKYRHPETVGDYSYAELEKRVFAALDANVRTLMRIKEHASLERGFDLSPVMEGMELDRKIRNESNGTITAFFRFGEMPKRFWNNGDGTVGVEFVEGYVPPKSAKDTAAEDYKKFTIGGTGRKPVPIIPKELEELAATLDDPNEIARNVGYKNKQGLAGRLKTDPLLKGAYDRGRRRFSDRRNLQNDFSTPATPAPIKPEKEKQSMSAATATAPAVSHKAKGIAWSVELFKDAKGRGESKGDLATRLKVTTQAVSQQLKKHPEYAAAFGKSVSSKPTRTYARRTEPTPGKVKKTSRPEEPQAEIVHSVSAEPSATSSDESVLAESAEIQKVEERTAPISERIRDLADGGRDDDRASEPKRRLLDALMTPSFLRGFMAEQRPVPLQRVIELESGDIVVVFNGNLFEATAAERAFVNEIVDRCETFGKRSARPGRSWLGRVFDRLSL
ncbi:MAG TPA: hypothetical protein VGO43_11820 [Pyrinomonadaceae bacterium]|jgi:hypothetical protein|nr:hypothetical protein [Pyrinomonadaceae bacterium]